MPSGHAFAFTALASGEPIAPGAFAGKALLVVNVASACGLTPQYRELEQLHACKAAKGLVVLGVPCNDFGGQEPGSEADIRAFCASNFAVSFPLAGKAEILSEERRHPFYAWVAQELGESGLPRWNFHKYLVGRDGALAASFASKTAPMSPEVLSAVEKALNA